MEMQRQDAARQSRSRSLDDAACDGERELTRKRRRDNSDDEDDNFPYILQSSDCIAISLLSRGRVSSHETSLIDFRGIWLRCISVERFSSLIEIVAGDF